ncbi:MAG: Pyridoxal-5'-phosphate-dependent protein beta subunit [Acidobacteria bacterium]|nr:Pyridoxal-5'-phosphate-dependent protein beta subunit [Acidobacteriota bacterium]
MNATPPTLRHVLEARQRLAGILRPTALIRHPLLADQLGLDVYVKHENHNPTCAFKVRGGLNLVASLGPNERAAGVVTATTGNHGQSVALACARFGVPCTIVVPLGNNPEKNAAIRAYGATLVEHGRDFDESRERAEQLRAERGLRYVHSANEPLLIAGVATYALEIFEELPDVGAIFVPIGGGSGASGVVTVRDALGSAACVVGVQAAGADAFARSWRGPTRVVGDRVNTLAEGLATRVTFDLTFGILQRGLEDVVLLSEDELREGVRLALRATHNLAEGAGAASIMAASRWRDRLRGQRVVCVMSGGNLDAATLARVLLPPKSGG